jgi:hypothetical protein
VLQLVLADRSGPVTTIAMLHRMLMIIAKNGHLTVYHCRGLGAAAADDTVGHGGSGSGSGSGGNGGSGSGGAQTLSVAEHKRVVMEPVILMQVGGSGGSLAPSQ